MTTDELKVLLEIREAQGRQGATMNQILEQTKKTNSRVTKLEDWKAEVEKAGKFSEGEKSVWGKVGGKAWDISKMAISAGIGAVVATLKGGK